MSILQVGRHGLHKGYPTLAAAINKAISGDVIILNNKRESLGANCLIKTGITIKSRDGQMTTLVTAPRNNGFVISKATVGEVKFQNLRVLVAEQSVLVNDSAPQATLTFDHCDIRHLPVARTWYPSVMMSTDGQGTLQIIDSQLDGLQAQPYALKVEKSSLGDVYGAFPQGWHPYSTIQFIKGSIVQSGLQNMLLFGASGNPEDVQVSLTRCSLGGNVHFQNLNAKLDHCRLMALPTVVHQGTALVLPKSTTALIAGVGSRISGTGITVDLDEVDSKKQTIPSWRALGVIKGGTLELHDSNLEAAPLASVAQLGSIGFDNVSDGNAWQAQADTKTMNRNSKSMLFKAVDTAKVQVAAQKGEAANVNGTAASVSAYDKLMAMPGLSKAKLQLKKILATAQTNAVRRKKGLPYNRKLRLHMIFAGPAGTGKTQVAKLFGQAMYENGALNSTNFVVAKQGDLVAGYKGQTAMKTQKKIDEAMDGILLVDEAYQLAPDRDGSDSSFNSEAVTTLIQAMENHPDRLIVILAGYAQPMRDFLDNGNEGLKSRIPNWISFPAYTPVEMKQIMRYHLKQISARFSSPQVLAAMDKGIDTLIPLAGPRSGNGRLVDNFVGRVTQMRDLRLANTGNINRLSDRALQVITTADVENAVKDMGDAFDDMN